MAKIIVDIDNTLWDLAPVLYDLLRKENPDLLPAAQWREWDFWRSSITPKTVYAILDRIHMQQDTFVPFTDAAGFLRSLKEMNLYIVVASHRREHALGPTERWLRKYDLVHDEIHLSHDKTVLFYDSWGVVDDSPETLDRARDAGIVRAGLRNPWNEGRDHPLFDNLTDIAGYLRRQKATGEHGSDDKIRA